MDDPSFVDESYALRLWPASEDRRERFHVDSIEDGPERDLLDQIRARVVELINETAGALPDTTAGIVRLCR